MPSSTERRRTDSAWSRSLGGPNTRGPGSCIAPKPMAETWCAPRRRVGREVIRGTVHTDRPSDSPPFPVRRWFRPRKHGFAVRVRWSEGYEDRLLGALVRQIEHDIATGAPGQRTSITLEEFIARN